MRLELLPALAVVFCLCAQPCDAKQLTEPELLTRLQAEAPKINNLQQGGKYREAIRILNGLRQIPGMMESVRARYEITLCLAGLCARTGERDATISWLRDAVDTGLLSSERIQSEKDFDAIRGDPALREIVGKLASVGRLWNSPALSTPYRENISDDEKAAGLSKLWSEVKFNFAFFGNVPDLDWDALYMEYMPKVRQTRSTLEYYRLLQEICAKLKDGHTGVGLPVELNEATDARPAIATRLIEGKVLITEVYGGTLESDGVRRGLEITKVDGVPVREYTERNVKPYEFASTSHALDEFAYGMDLLCGPKPRPVKLTMGGPDGGTVERELSREVAWKGFAREPFQFGILDRNIACVIVNAMDAGRVPEMFRSAFPQISKADALVIDVRCNGGGSSSVGWDILACLTDKPFLGHGFKTLNYRPYSRAQGLLPGWYGMQKSAHQPNGQLLYTKPVAVLTSAFTGSAAEDFCLAFDAMRRGKLIGEPTAGSTGQPLYFQLPGGGFARVCTVASMYPDGRGFVGVGIQPDILVKPTVRDFRAGRDTVLEAALEYLRGKVGRR